MYVDYTKYIAQYEHCTSAQCRGFNIVVLPGFNIILANFVLLKKMCGFHIFKKQSYMSDI